jgi:hypothetical protein
MLPTLATTDRALLLAALVGAAAVALPTAARAQSIAPERALLNRGAATPIAAAPVTPESSDELVSGEQALLSHSHTARSGGSTPVVIVQPEVADAVRVDGVKALLNRATS